MVAGCGDTDLVITGGAAWYRVHSVRATASSLAHAPYGNYSLLTTHHPPLTTHHPPLTTHHSTFTLNQVSNIIKQFKLSCSKTQAQFATLQVP